jgi:hypothetical protein
MISSKNVELTLLICRSKNAPQSEAKSSETIEYISWLSGLLRSLSSSMNLWPMNELSIANMDGRQLELYLLIYVLQSSLHVGQYFLYILLMDTLHESFYKAHIIAKLYEMFIRDKVLPLCTTYPGPWSILVIDNAKIHHPQYRAIYTCCEMG